MKRRSRAPGNLEKIPALRELPAYWSPYKRGKYDRSYEVDTGVAQETLAEISNVLTSAPDGFHVHPKIKKLLEQRAEMGAGKRIVDYGFAELLAFGALLREGTPVRLSGQDTRRGTFNQRHAAIIDNENEAVHIALKNLTPNQAQFEVYNSTLSEAGVLGFEYGFSRDFPEALVLWEAQFGDFVNGAQVIIDQFISAGEDKWDLPSGVVLLLPHGFEGQGPEHSSARMERFLQLAAENNIQICQPSSAAQYFHMLRRQAMRPWRKPLIVFTPKSMLRNPLAGSPLADLTEAYPRFLPVVPENEIGNGQRVLVCTGKIGHELREERTRRKDSSTAIVFSGSTLSVSGRRIGGGIGAAHRRNCLGAGRAGKYGRAFQCSAEIAKTGGRASRASGAAFAERESGDRIGEGARDGAEDADHSGVYDWKSLSAN